VVEQEYPFPSSPHCLGTEEMSYTTIDLEKRERLDISFNEYVIADFIANLAKNQKSKVQGWCYASKDKMGREFGLDRRNILRILNRLLDKKLIERDEETKFLRPIEAWECTVSDEKSPLVSKSPKGWGEKSQSTFQNRAQSGVKTPHNIDSNIDNTKTFESSSQLAKEESPCVPKTWGQLVEEDLARLGGGKVYKDGKIWVEAEKGGENV
jgi:hypothetical protein